MLAIAPFSRQELWDAFDSTHSMGKHLLTIYSITVGMNAQRIAELGIGATTRALRLAARTTGGTVYSCDGDRKRFAALDREQDDHWRLALTPSDRFLRALDGPLDVVVHDGAHDYPQVRLDLELALPKMRTFGVILIHDTQQPDLAADILAAIRDATEDWQTSFTVLPFSAGLGILRLERACFPAPDVVACKLPDGRPETKLRALAPEYGEVDTARGRLRRRARRSVRRKIKGF